MKLLLKKKDFLLQATEGSLAELQAKNARLNEELLKTQTTLKEKSERFEQEKKDFKTNLEAEAEKSSNIHEITQGSARKMLRLRHLVHPTVEASL